MAANALGGVVTWYSPANWQAPYACTRAIVHTIGGGGGGFSDKGPEVEGTNGKGGGGAGAGVGLVDVSNMTPLAFYTITVGAGGQAGAYQSSSSNPGGNTSFSGPGVYVFGNGGAGGKDGKSTSSGGTGSTASGSPGAGDRDQPNARQGGSAGGCGTVPGSNTGREISIPGSCTYGGGHGRGGKGGNNGGTGSPGSAGAVQIQFYYEDPTAAIQINNNKITIGQSVTVTTQSTWAVTASVTNIGNVSAPTSANIVYPSTTGTVCYTLSVGGMPGTATATAGPVCVEVYPEPVIVSYTLSDYSPLSGDSVTLSWSTTGGVSVSRTVNNVAGGLGAAGSMSATGSVTFTAGTGGVYNTVLSVTNGAGKTVTSSPLVFTVRDETPNSFGWDDKIDVSFLQRENQESNTITINGFGPTQYPLSKLPIKSNYPVQVMVNGDGIWRDVESI
jgi:hypothetical protein